MAVAPPEAPPVSSNTSPLTELPTGAGLHVVLLRPEFEVSSRLIPSSNSHWSTVVCAAAKPQIRKQPRRDRGNWFIAEGLNSVPQTELESVGHCRRDCVKRIDGSVSLFDGRERPDDAGSTRHLFCQTNRPSTALACHRYNQLIWLNSRCERVRSSLRGNL